MDQRTKNKKWHMADYGRRLARLLGVAAVATSCLTACEGYDLADNEPAWLGESIYNYLDGQGNYTNLVRIIDELGYKEVLSRTGSKTLFVADDDAFQRFFKANDWGVHSYDKLTLAQKKLLLYGAMINNSCQVAYLSSSEGPTEGDCMRRETSTSLYDSVPVIHPEEMPDNPYWQYYRDNNKAIPCFVDMTTAPMIHFIESFLQNRLITNDDCDFLFNYRTKRKPGDANVNGILMTEQNIKCSNGFVHKMDSVITPLPNMAQLINQKSNMSGYAKLLNRFCAPYYAGDNAVSEYNRLYNTSVDSVFEKRYFSKKSRGGVPVDLTPAPEEGPVNGMLKFDPGWNQLYSSTMALSNTTVAVQENMSLMIVPSNTALDKYWNSSVLSDYYDSWEDVPDDVIAKMINVGMINSFTGSVPSKFHTVLNDANDELGIKKEDVDSVFMACNGAVYMTNRVFNPVAYMSVTFPALVDEKMKILYWAVEQLQYDVYLNSQHSFYSLFIPDNGALLEYIDPCSFGKTDTRLFRFHYKADAQKEREKVWASMWKYDVASGTVGDSIPEAVTYEMITNRLEDILNTHIVIGDVDNPNCEYFQTKGGSVIRVKNAAAANTGGMTVQGGWQIEQGKELMVSRMYDESADGGNGRTYILKNEPIMTARKSVADVLEEHEEFSAFSDLLQKSQYLETVHKIGEDTHGCPSQNVSLFNTFRYTVLVPSNEDIKTLQTEKKLPTWKMVDDAMDDGDDELADSLRNEIEMFIKYHIVDNSFFVGEESENGQYETSAYIIDEDKNLRYMKVNIKSTSDGLTITDLAGNERHVVTSNKGLYNLMAREYQYDSGDVSVARTIYTSSNAVIHRIDGVLNYK